MESKEFNQTTKVDVIINVYGKPWQTLCTLKSLMLHSGEYIDKIYFIEEREQPYGDNVKWVLNEFDNIIHYIPNKYVFIPSMNHFGDLTNIQNRCNFRYQYGIEKSDKKYVFITHNDILYTGDIIGDMLLQISNSAGIGLVGQCWNCPAFNGNLCNNNIFLNCKATYEEVSEAYIKFASLRSNNTISIVDKNRPMPLPECRLNEFACLINKDICIEECPPKGNSRFFGAYDVLDLGDAWFRDLVLKGYTFKNYDIHKTSMHGYYSQVESEVRVYEKDINEETYKESKFFVSGYPTQLDHIKYVKADEFAKNYYYKNFK